MDEPIVIEERKGRVLLLRMNRPEARNALNPELMAALGRAFHRADEDPAIGCIVLGGTGDRAFCAGMDLRAFSRGEGASPEEQEEARHFAAFLKGETAVPVVGAANATAVAGGFEVLLACDVVVASDQAKFGLPEVKRGLFAAGGGVLLGGRMPLAVALELTLTGEPIAASRAYELGLINRIVPPGEVLDQAVAMAETIARNAPLALAATRELVRTSAEDMAKARSLLTEWLPKVFQSSDAKEGSSAFIERREPVWTGT